MINLFIRIIHRFTRVTVPPIIWEGSIDYGARFTLYPSSGQPEALVVWESYTNEIVHSTFDDVDDLMSEYYLLQLGYKEYLQYGQQPLKDLSYTDLGTQQYADTMQDIVLDGGLY